MSTRATKSPWRNRIVGHAEIDPEQLLANSKNWRIHPSAQQDALESVIEDVGYVDPVIVQSGTDVVINGHLRVALALRSEQRSIPVTYVDLDDEESDVILATFDPISAMADTDSKLLKELLDGIDRDDEDIQSLLDDLAEREGISRGGDGIGDDSENQYTTKIESPIYTPTGEQPSVHELIDTRRRDALVSDIDAADLPDPIRAFLTHAAERHTVFDYRMIAEFYAHAEPDTQRLMEDSALVIIDAERAIELGYANLRAELMELSEEAENESFDA